MSIVGVFFLIMTWAVPEIQKELEEMERIEIARQEYLKEQQEKAEAATYPQPTITLLSKEGEQGNVSEYELQFSVTGAEEVLINGEEAKGENNIYKAIIPLKSPYETIRIFAGNKYKDEHLTVSVSRDKTPEELKAEQEEKLRQELADMKKAPQDYITLVKNDWYLGGFGSIPIHTVTLKNTSKVNYKNITFTVKYSANSGDILDVKEHTIYDNLPAGTTKTFREINMGFTDQQVTSSRLEVVWAETYE